ncbi:hypothetical protein FRX31_006039 [Thalictrum thalictroides]|uniref:Transmembrane protein n=1 Tax=Thalictrum thalictroides TaxID=46969 RepID=A0A7J6X3R6_THATH|nr:hypothetical protein FRX31_006039 [Thalictrum thalictroides]
MMKSLTMSIKRFCLLSMIVVLVVFSQSSLIHCRTLRSTGNHSKTNSSGGVKQQHALSVSSPCAPSPSENLMFELASGPNKKGRGH